MPLRKVHLPNSDLAALYTVPRPSTRDIPHCLFFEPTRRSFQTGSSPQSTDRPPCFHTLSQHPAVAKSVQKRGPSSNCTQIRKSPVCGPLRVPIVTSFARKGCRRTSFGFVARSDLLRDVGLEKVSEFCPVSLANTVISLYFDRQWQLYGVWRNFSS